ncbi:MAG: HPr family phosphocarrier protein [Gemmataceae bacterium]
MNAETLQRKVVISNPLGFHLRPISAFARTASQFDCAVTVARDQQRVNGKSPLELMLLGAEQGTELLLEITGNDAHAALDALIQVLNTSWDHDEGIGPAAVSPER